MSIEYHRAWRAENPDKCAAYTKKYRAKNPEKRREYEAEYRKKNAAKMADYQRRYRIKNNIRMDASQKRWRIENPDNVRRWVIKWSRRNRDKINANYRRRCASDPAFKIGKILRARISDALRNFEGKKGVRSVLFVGCSKERLIGHLVALFDDGMSLDNYGPVWEIDHRKPCASFDLTSERERAKCFHFTNLQPMFVSENRRKHAKLNWRYQGNAHRPAAVQA